jgi:UDP-N-acetyl-D-mannosaminuronic acid dehydrogenase
MFATHGFDVTGVDVNKSIVRKLNAGKLHIHEPGLNRVFRNAITRKKLKFKTKVVCSDVFIICVPTPLIKGSYRADLSYVMNAAHSIVPQLESGNLVILESTVPPRTLQTVLVPILENSNLKAGIDFYVAYSPERVLPGNIVEELIHNDRVIGGYTLESALRAKNLYRSFVRGKIHVTTAVVAECVKLLENAYRDVNIAFVNEMTKLFEQIGANIWEVIQLANKHPRVHLHAPGPGVGGHCIPIDPWFLYERAPPYAQMIKLSRKINNSMAKYVFAHVKSAVKGIRRPQITIFGVAYKGNVEDTRESPAIEFIQLARAAGYKTRIYDPYVKKFKYKLYDLISAVKHSDCIVVLTDHDVFKSIKPTEIGSYMRHKYIVDTRNLLQLTQWQAAGFNVKLLGSTSSNH